MISFKCSQLLFKHKRILRTVFYMIFSEISGVILLISSVMSFNYGQMIQEYLLPQLEDLETMAILRAAFTSLLISRFGDVPSPLRTPDLYSPDFFLWRCLKGKIYINKPNTLHELKNIIDEINRLAPVILENTVRRIRLCLNNNGEHLKDIIFKQYNFKIFSFISYVTHFYN